MINDHRPSQNPYHLLYEAATLIPHHHYILGLFIALIVFIYNFLEFHIIEDALTWFWGAPVSLTYNSCSDVYNGVVSKCKILHGRYVTTPWLASPHIQTTFLNFFGRAPVFSYRRQLYHASDGGTIALDWLLSSDVSGNGRYGSNFISKDDTTPIVVVIPGLTSDSGSPYLKHLAFNTAKHGWNVLVSNHRGLGGVSVTSDCFYNAGWTEDAREVINYLHREYTKAPLYAIGTSIGANILVKYLGEDRDNVPIAGAVAICSPWDLLIGDRFISRRLVQRLYDRALCIGLQGYAQLHQPQYSRLANWEGIEKSRSIRDFDNYATCLVGKFETVDTYYRRCSSTSFVDKVSVPLLCISALDDPLCTREAIPWDECRANKNIVLATTKHGGHLAFFEGVSASGLWWVRASLEFLSILHGSPYKHRQNKMHNSEPHSSQVTTIDQGPYISVSEGMVAAMSNEPHDVVENTSEQLTSQDRVNNELDLDSDYSEVNVNSPIQRCFSQLSRQNKTLILLLSYIAVVSTWPLVGAGFRFLLKKKLKGIVPTKLQK